MPTLAGAIAATTRTGAYPNLKQLAGVERVLLGMATIIVDAVDRPTDLVDKQASPGPFLKPSC